MTTITLIILLSLLQFKNASETETVTLPDYNKAKLTGRIVKGYACAIEQYSHLAVISLQWKLLCGGTLLSSHWVLTAAHCCVTFRDPLSKYFVRAGIAKWQVHSDDQSTGIYNMYVHKDYMWDPLQHDICLLNLTGPIRENAKVKYTKLATGPQFLDMQTNNKCHNATIMGFGVQTVQPIQRSKSYDYHAQCVHLSLLPKEKCQDLVSAITNSVICARDLTAIGRDACQGDSGGPMLCQGIQIGIVSAGYGCGIPEYPSLYTRVDIYADFIRDVQSGVYLTGNQEEKSLNPADQSDATTRLPDKTSFLFCFLLVLHVQFW